MGGERNDQIDPKYENRRTPEENSLLWLWVAWLAFLPQLIHATITTRRFIILDDQAFPVFYLETSATGWITRILVLFLPTVIGFVAIRQLIFDEPKKSEVLLLSCILVLCIGVPPEYFISHLTMTSVVIEWLRVIVAALAVCAIIVVRRTYKEIEVAVET